MLCWASSPASLAWPSGEESVSWLVRAPVEEGAGRPGPRSPSPGSTSSCVHGRPISRLTPGALSNPTTLPMVHPQLWVTRRDRSPPVYGGRPVTSPEPEPPPSPTTERVSFSRREGRGQRGTVASGPLCLLLRQGPLPTRPVSASFPWRIHTLNKYF